jgi:hypothetical protein
MENNDDKNTISELDCLKWRVLLEQQQRIIAQKSALQQNFKTLQVEEARVESELKVFVEGTVKAYDLGKDYNINLETRVIVRGAAAQPTIST